MIKPADKILLDELVKNSVLLPEDMAKHMEEIQNANETLPGYLIKHGFMTDKQILVALSEGLQLPMVDLKSTPINKNVIDKVPVKFAGYYKFMPVKIEGKTLTMAVSYPLDVKIQDEIRVHVGYEPRTVLTTESDLNDAIKKHYGLAAETIDRILSKDPIKKTSDMVPWVEDLEKKSEDASISKLVNQIILEAYQKRATDIHIEPYRDKVRFRYRIDGVLVDANLPADVKHFLLPVLSRIKIMANLSIVEKRLPQDGSAVVKTKDQDLDLRVSTIPTPRGESMVIRILPSRVMLYSLEKLGIDKNNVLILRELVKKPHGIIFVTGPTGSGKTTTLYACLNEINSAERKIITIEDPVEYEMEGITQIQVNPKVSLDFATGLRSILRHDPDIIMVGEVRDLETAEIAIRTALTGHLVFSTLHTNDAASGITRLIDMGLEPFLVASSIEAFVAQRLVRIICPHCKEEVKSSIRDIREEMQEALNIKEIDQITIYQGRGCDYCNRTGFYGRTAIYEILIINEAMRVAILEKPQADHIKKMAIRQGMRTLRQDGWKKVMEGITTPAEVMNVTVKEDFSGLAPAISSALPKQEMFNAEKKGSMGSLYKIITNDIYAAKNETYSRIYPRSIAEVQIRYKLNNVDKTVKGVMVASQVEYATVTRDISAGGVCFISRYPIPIGTILELKFQLGDEFKNIDCLAKVCRAEEDHQGQIYNIVAYYLDISSADRVKVNNFVMTKLKLGKAS